MSWYARRDLRKIHRWGAILIALPFLIVLVTGLFLQVKKEFSWIQPPTQKGSISYQTPDISFEDVLAISQSAPDAGIHSWEDIDRLDVRPDDGTVKVRSTEGWELQIDLGTGEILSSMRRRSDVIEAIHDGSWFHDQAKLWIFLPSAVVVTILWITGIYLFCLPYIAKRKNRIKLRERKNKRKRKRKREKEKELQEAG